VGASIGVAGAAAADPASVAPASAASASALVPVGTAAPAAPSGPAPSGLAGDTRSSGEGPGLVGAPGLAIGLVVVIGLGAVGGTLAYVRLTGGPRRP
jgi:hypothetical protein